MAPGASNGMDSSPVEAGGGGVQEIVREAPAAVLHLWEAGFAADLDELLTTLALRHPGTRVVRAPLSRCGDWLQRLRRPAEPLLLAAKRGRVVGVVGVAELTRLADSGSGDGGRGDAASDVSSDFGDSDAAPSLVRALLWCLPSREVSMFGREP